MHSFIPQHLLSDYYVPDTTIGSDETRLGKNNPQLGPCSSSAVMTLNHNLGYQV